MAGWIRCRYPHRPAVGTHVRGRAQPLTAQVKACHACLKAQIEELLAVLAAELHEAVTSRRCARRAHLRAGDVELRGSGDVPHRQVVREAHEGVRACGQVRLEVGVVGFDRAGAVVGDDLHHHRRSSRPTLSAGVRTPTSLHHTHARTREKDRPDGAHPSDAVIVVGPVASRETVSAGRRRYPDRVAIRAVLWVAVACLAVGGISASGWAADTPPGVLRIVFPEGWSARQMADRVAEVRRIAIERRGVTPRLTGADYTRAARRARPPRGFRAEAGNNVEGFLFPALYHFEGHTTAETLVANQLAAFEQRWRTVDLRPARHRGRTSYEVLTIASMVERETVAPEERRLVAAVIYNRLDRDMPLGIDATLRYGLGIPGTKPLTKTHLASSSPYNTRRFRVPRRPRSATPGLRPSAPLLTQLPSTICTTSASRTNSTTSSPPTTKSSAGRRASTATPADRFDREDDGSSIARLLGGLNDILYGVPPTTADGTCTGAVVQSTNPERGAG